jgi:flagellar basal body L-ring protein FlgH
MNQAILAILLFLVSCANYVNNVHRQIDREERGGRRAQTEREEPWQERYHPHSRRFRADNDKRPIKNPVTYSLSDGGPSNQMRPPVKRDYRPQRHSAQDFRDNDSDGSLWANQGQAASLFTYQTDKRPGDMVIINVLENLRNQISAELKRAYPDKPKRTKDGDKKKGEEKTAAAAPAPGAAAGAEEMDMKVYDKISGSVLEEVNKDYILLRGRKEVIFKKEKRSIEVQALVSRKDIMENDYVNSDRLLESRVYVLRDRQ